MPITKPRNHAKKISRNDKIIRILAKVTEICDYAAENQCTEQAQFEELEWMLNRYIYI